MILVGNARGGAKDLALHLMKDENERVEVHGLRGFASETLMGALNEAYAVSRGTKCRQFLYSLSLNPPQGEAVKVEHFESAIEKAETKLGLNNQPRAIVFHEKNGRRHAHAVWSRIDTEQMKAVQLSYDHRKLNALSRELYLEHGWKMPRGLVNSQERNPKNFTLDEWQQAKRTNRDPRQIKTAIQDAWAISDSKVAFTHAMEERGFKIARGDKGRYVALDIHGEVWSIPRQANVKTKDVRQRLGDAKALPSVDETKVTIATEMSVTLGRFQKQINVSAEVQKHKYKDHLSILVERQKAERTAQHDRMLKRQLEENAQRLARFRKGIGGLWDRLRGEHERIVVQNERETMASIKRDLDAKAQLTLKQQEQRRQQQARSARIQIHYAEQKQEIKSDLLQYREMKTAAVEAKREEFMHLQRQTHDRKPHRSRSRGPEPER